MGYRFIESLQHPLVKQTNKLKKDKEYRQQEKLVLVEGLKQIADLGKVFKFKLLLVEKGIDIPQHLQSDEVILVSSSVMKKISHVEEPQGMMGILSYPNLSSLSLERRKMVILDGIQDPGNVGTLIRTAWALGWDGIVMIKGSADPFSYKALSASSTAAFLIPIFHLSREECLVWLQEDKRECWLADLGGCDFQTLNDVSEKIALVLGNEGKGPHEDFKKIGTKITLRMIPEADSLNVGVAGGILMYNIGSFSKKG